jgi:hypothetical protein
VLDGSFQAPCCLGRVGARAQRVRYVGPHANRNRLTAPHPGGAAGTSAAVAPERLAASASMRSMPDSSSLFAAHRGTIMAVAPHAGAEAARMELRHGSAASPAKTGPARSQIAEDAPQSAAGAADSAGFCFSRRRCFFSSSFSSRALARRSLPILVAVTQSKEEM